MFEAKIVIFEYYRKNGYIRENKYERGRFY
jgi:hypothetical protein